MARNTKNPKATQSFGDVIKSLSPKKQSTVAKEVMYSTFQAHHVPIRHLSEIRPALALVNGSPGVGSATHNIWAARIGNSEIICDDGEYGGAYPILERLRLAQEKDCIVVVSRWFGGIHMGRKRFSVIESMSDEVINMAQALSE